MTTSGGGFPARCQGGSDGGSRQKKASGQRSGFSDGKPLDALTDEEKPELLASEAAAMAALLAKRRACKHNHLPRVIVHR
jgi:hypothetical protein